MESPSATQSLESRKNESPYFDMKAAQPPAPNYVCWLDLMGTQSHMRLSLRTTANFIGKLHEAAQTVLQSTDSKIELFPIIDGLYLCSATRPPLLSFLKETMTKMAILFALEDNNSYRCLVRGALAYGPVIKGSQILNCAKALGKAPDYTGRILLGIPLVQAHDAERSAPPFGIYLHESVRTFAAPYETPMDGVTWKWWQWNPSAQDSLLVDALKQSVEQFCTWAELHSASQLYDRADILRHRELFREYFAAD